MAARAVCSATITFSLVSVPVKLYVTASPNAAKFNLLTPEGHRVKQKWVDAETGTDVEYADLLKGVEVSKGQFVTFTQDELDGLAGEKNGLIEVDAFAKDIVLNPLTVEKTYYLVPDKSDAAYRLLVAALVKSGKAATGTWYNRGKDNLIAITAHNDTLVLNQMYYQEEIRDVGQTFAANSEPVAAQVDIALALLNRLTMPFNIGAHKDTYVERVGMAVAAKAAGVKRGAIETKANVVAMDLVDLLKASLDQEGSK